MTTDKYNALYDTYKNWIGLPLEIAMPSTLLGVETYKKFLLKGMSWQAMTEEAGQESIAASVLLQDLETSKDHHMNLSDFDKSVRLIPLGAAPTIKLSNLVNTGHVVLGNSIEYLDIFIIQINSHVGKKAADWTKVAENIYIDVNLISTTPNPSVITDRVYLSSLFTNQIQPIFHMSRKYPIRYPNTTRSAAFYDRVEFVVRQLMPINEDYEITIVYTINENSLYLY